MKNSKCNNITEYLLGLNTDHISDLSLYYGAGGVAMACLLSGKHYDEPDLTKQGQKLLESISENIANLDQYTIDRGTTGIGWMVEWLIQSSLLMDTDSDEVLEEMDDSMYRNIMSTDRKMVPLKYGILSDMAYFLKRGLAKNKYSNRYRKICHQECLVVLVNRLSEFYESAMIEDNVVDTAGLLITAERFVKINKEALDILYGVIRFSDNYLSKFIHYTKHEENVNSKKVFDALYLAITYYLAGERQGLDYWQQQAISYIEQLLMISQNAIVEKVDLSRKLKVYTLLNIYYWPEGRYADVVAAIIEELMESKLDYNLTDGYGLLAISQISLENKNILKDWYEVIFYI